MFFERFERDLFHLIGLRAAEVLKNDAFHWMSPLQTYNFRYGRLALRLRSLNANEGAPARGGLGLLFLSAVENGRSRARAAAARCGGRLKSCAPAWSRRQQCRATTWNC